MFAQVQFRLLSEHEEKPAAIHSRSMRFPNVNVEECIISLLANTEASATVERFVPDLIVCNPRTYDYAKRIIKNQRLRWDCLNVYGRELTVIATDIYQRLEPVGCVAREQLYWLVNPGTDLYRFKLGKRIYY